MAVVDWVLLHLPFRMVDDSFSVPLLLDEQPDLSNGEAYRLREVFSMSSREEQFVRALLRRKRNLWVFRCHQQKFCGDFAVVDMSHPHPSGRSVYLIELKARTPLKEGGSGGQQMRNADAVLAALRARSLISDTVQAEILQGDKDAVLSRLGIDFV